MDQDLELARMREHIDEINQRLVEVLHERARTVRRIGVLKQASGMAVLDPVREQTMLTQLVRDVPADGFSAVSLERILQSVFAASREVVAAPQKHRGPT